MFGYVIPDCETVSVQDFSLLRAVYCGICLATKRRYGNLARLAVNYDITAFALLALEAENVTPEFGACRCIGDPRKKPYAKECGTLDRMADVNILLCRHKAVDDVIDSGRKSSPALRMLAKPYEKAKAARPDEENVIASGYARLRAAEEAGETSLDRAGDCFAKLLEELIVPSLSGRDAAYSDNMRRLCYNIGKFVYLADAIDDLDEDFTAKRYNPVLAAAPDYEKGGRRGYMERHGDMLRFAVNSTVNSAIARSNALTFTQADGLLRNIIYEGLRKKADELFGADKKLPPPKVYLPRRTAKAFRSAMRAKKAGDKGKK